MTRTAPTTRKRDTAPVTTQPAARIGSSHATEQHMSVQCATRVTVQRATCIEVQRATRIEVQRATRAGGIPTDRKFRRWACAAHPGPLDIAVRIVGAAEGRELNRRFRAKDYATNVLSFNYCFDYRSGAALLLQGDIVLCAPVVRREARAQGKSLEAHYAHLLVHGLLHLAGHDHESGADAVRMERAERRILGRLGYPDPYAAEAMNPA